MAEIIIQTSRLADQSLIADVTVSNTQRLNCIDSTLALALAAGFKQLASEPALRAVRLQGNGRRAFDAPQAHQRMQAFLNRQRD